MQTYAGITTPSAGAVGPAGPAGPQYVANGSFGTPNDITAVGGISILGNSREFQFIRGSGGPVVVTANPQIQAGTTVGQELLLQGNDDVNTVTLSDGTGLNLNGACVLKNKSRLLLVWDGEVWGEESRNDI